MVPVKGSRQGTPEPRVNERCHPMPRRATPEKSVTLRHHRLARDASMRPEPGSKAGSGGPQRRLSSGESNYTGQSDPKHWFDRSNRNPPAAFDHATMDVDPPFFQKRSDSSNEGFRSNGSGAVPYSAGAYLHPHFPPKPAHSSSADDFRSVIDDLTIENRRLKEELKRFKQYGPDPMRKDKLFEIKYHGLPKKKKMELEVTLREFASSLDGSTTSSQQRKKSSKNVNRLQGSSSNSKHASSSSSHWRPVDSAYASMSTGPSSAGPHASTSSVGRPSLVRAGSSMEQKVENYLRDIPEGLLPRHITLTDKEKTKLVVRRLEQLFTGKMIGKNRRNQQIPLESQLSNRGVISAPPLLSGAVIPNLTAPVEPTREARIRVQDTDKKDASREELSVTNSNGDNETRENRTGSGSGSNEHSNQDGSPQDTEPNEQRATRPLDLDPDRVQIPSENMQYIRHLGVMAPEYLDGTKFKHQDVSMDADGWIHLNLLCNLAQLHILNVTPDYIRSAIAERSAKFQLSRDGRKIRWRGGTEGTKFSSDSSGDNSLRSPDTEITDGSNDGGQRKRQKRSIDRSTISSKSQTKFGAQPTASTETFHYKPMFIHNHSSSIETSLDDTGSQISMPAAENSNFNSRSTGFASRSASTPRKKRRRDGAIIYYTGAPFCLDLSGDPSDVSPTTYMTASANEADHAHLNDDSPRLTRTASGSMLPFRPLEDGVECLDSYHNNEAEYVVDDKTEAVEPQDYGFSWSKDPEKTQLNPLSVSLEPCGLGGVTPEDRFAYVVVTRHPMQASCRGLPTGALNGDSSNQSSVRPPLVRFQVLEKKFKALRPLPLPPPAMFYPPFTETTESDDSGFEDDYQENDDDSDILMDDFEEAMSQRANPHQSDNDYAAIGELGSSEEDHLSRSKMIAKIMERHPDSSGATVGEASGYSSGREESG
ncbi:frequency clock protein [Coniella lustricola]|uniref:Frequency clock protein n=1 Tax=Coniella lustricola TaxID=2025994 RepID=A0A2T3AHQ2_9PEZI|nr:frequency clock protein [Coniella lustricola]